MPIYEIHYVRRGDTLSLLARKYRTSVRAIMEANGLRSTRYLKVGWKLKIPTLETARYRKRGRGAVATVTPSPQTGEVGSYIVERGDSLWKIANRFGTTVRALKSLNDLEQNDLKVGQVLKVPKAPSQKPAAPRRRPKPLNTRFRRVIHLLSSPRSIGWTSRSS